jgi:hypothetical protein
MLFGFLNPIIPPSPIFEGLFYSRPVQAESCTS